MKKLKHYAKRIPGARRAVIAVRRLWERRSHRPNVPPGWSGPGGERAEFFHQERITWRDTGPSHEIVERARAFTHTQRGWRRLDVRLAVVYASLLLEHGDLDDAESVVRRLAAGGHATALARSILLAAFARTLGIVDPSVDRAAEVADSLRNSDAVSALRALTAQRSVAVVGNGSSTVGSGLGDEIDAHDVVIRFNNYPSGFGSDLGSRTDVWVRGAHRDVRDRFELDDFALVVWEMDLFRNLLEVPNHASILHRDTQFAPQKTVFLNTAIKQSLRESSGLGLPSSGAQLLWTLFLARGTLADVSVYGFSTIEGNSDHGHFFDNLGDLGARHDAAGEGAFLRDLLAGGVAIVDQTAARHEPQDATTLVADIGVPHAPQNQGWTIVSSAFREYDPTTGKTGGPAGVLATQQFALDASHNGHRLEYLFRTSEARTLRRRLSTEVVGLSTKTAEVVVGAEFVRASSVVTAARERGDRLAFVCHELGSAYGAYLIGAPYVVVYHGQGSTMQELRSIGQTPSPREEAVAGRLERLVLENATAIYFPSEGARETFLRTSGLDADSLPLAVAPLYNTVSAVDHQKPSGPTTTVSAAIHALDLPPASPDRDVFISVGDYNRDKGLDRVPALLSRYAEKTGREVLWIAVGRAADPDLLAALESERENWNFEARLIGERLDHDTLLALLEYGDYYVMLHRAAIFDLATLEAMRAGLPLILSPVGGNLEVNLDDNVVLATESDLDSVCAQIVARDVDEWSRQSRRVFEQHFSLDHFVARYREMLDNLIGR